VGLKHQIKRGTAGLFPRHAPRVVVGALLLSAMVLPLAADSVGRDLAVRITYYVLLVASWNVLAGYAGLYSFGHVAFAAIGAYSTVLVADWEGLQFEYAFLIGGGLAAAVGILLGLLSSRIRGPYLVVASFGLLVAVQTIVLANPSLTGGAGGSVVPRLFSAQEPELRYYLFGLLLVGVFFAISIMLLRSRPGKVIAALRDDEDGAVAIGINPLPWKTAIFAYTSMWAGIAGVFLAQYTGFVTPSIGGVPEMSIVVAMGVAGGLGTLVGPIISTGALLYLSDKLRVVGEGYATLLFGVVLLFVVVAVPLIRRRVRARPSQTGSPVPESVEEIEVVTSPGTGGVRA